MYQTISHSHVVPMYSRFFVLVFTIVFLSMTTAVSAQNPEWLVYNSENSELPEDEVIELAFDPAGTMWIGTRRNGLARFDGETWSIYNMDNSQLPSNTIPALAVDPQGELFVGTADGLGLFDRQAWYAFTSERTDLPYHAIHALANDAGGELWIGTGEFYGEGGGGLAKFNKRRFKWTVYNTENSELPGNQILALAVDHQNNLWVGTVENNGVAMFDGKTWTSYTSKNSDLPRGSVTAIACDAQGTIWIGTDGGGLARFDGTAWIVYTTRNSELPSNTVYALALDSQENLWIGTEQGLAKFDGTTWTTYTTDNSDLPDGWVWALIPDIQGNLWIGTMVGGVAVYREGGLLFPEKATKVEDLVGVWEGWFVGSKTYRQFEADGTLKCAAKVEWLEDPSSLNYSGKFWFEGGELKITENLMPTPGAYKVLIRKRDGKTAHLSFYDIGDPNLMRAHDWGRGMTRVEP